MANGFLADSSTQRSTQCPIWLSSPQLFENGSKHLKITSLQECKNGRLNVHNDKANCEYIANTSPYY